MGVTDLGTSPWLACFTELRAGACWRCQESIAGRQPGRGRPNDPSARRGAPGPSLLLRLLHPFPNDLGLRYSEAVRDAVERRALWHRG